MTQKMAFVKLVKLVDLTYEDETAEQRKRWLNNLKISGVEQGYGLDDDGTKLFSTDDIEFFEVECYNFIGSAFEDERFYAADWLTVKEKATGDIYALETEDIYEF